MNKETSKQGDTGILAVLHRSGKQWYGVIARIGGLVPQVLDSRCFADSAEHEIDRWVAESRAAEAVVVLPASAVICRTCTLPMAEPEQLARALELQAEVHLTGVALEHRRGLAVLPAAAGETSRTGIIVAWPQSAPPPDLTLNIPTSYVPDIASLAALLNGTRPVYPLLWVDRADGSVSIALSHSGGAALRSTSEDVSGGEGWESEVGRALAETGLNVGHSASFVQSLAENCMQRLADLAPGESRLLLPPEIVERATNRVATGSEDPQWWMEFGIAAGALLARTSDLAPLTHLKASAPQQRPSLIRTAVETMSHPSTAIKTLILLALVVGLGQPLFNGLRLQLLRLRYRDIDRQLVEINEVKDLRAMYMELADQSWTMTKLIADIACNTPENIELDSIRINQGDTIAVKGTVLPDKQNDRSARDVAAHMQSLLQESRMFEDVTLDWGDPNNFGNYQFDLSAKVSRPHRRVEYARELDFGVWPLRVRLYGDPPDTGDAPLTAEGGTTPAETEGTASVAIVEDQEPVRSPEESLALAPERTAADPPRRSPYADTDRPGGDDLKSRAGGDSANADVRSLAEDIPPPLSEEQIKAMTKSEALEMLSRVGRSRSYAKKIGDEGLRERLNREWQMLLERIKES